MTTRTISILTLLVCLTASGCAWIPRHRKAGPDERLQLQTAVVGVPAGGGWKVSREFEPEDRSVQAVEGLWSRVLRVREQEGLKVPAPEALATMAASHGAQIGARYIPGLERAVTPLPVDPTDRFGAVAPQAAVRLAVPGAPPGTPVLRAATLAFMAPEARGLTTVFYAERGAADAEAEARFQQTWRAVVASTEARAANDRNLASAARVEFPKYMEAGFVRRSVTLPRGGLQLGLSREWWCGGKACERWGDRAGPTQGDLRIGLTDHLELDSPGHLVYAFGDPTAITGPELAIGAGLTGYDHDAVRGSTWGYGLTLRGRQRIGNDLALRVSGLAEATHATRAPRRDRDRPGVMGTAGLVWDVGRYLSLGLEAGYSHRPWEGLGGARDTDLVWVGGRSTPLVTAHLFVLDVGLTGALTWQRGVQDAVAGVSFALTL